MHDLRHLAGPFDIFGDVHGCAVELIALFDRLGYASAWRGAGAARRAEVRAPADRLAVFVGDLVDRGPASPDVLRIVMAMVGDGQAVCIPGNHDAKFQRWLGGRNVTPSHGLDRSIAQFGQESATFREEVRRFLDGLPLYAWLDQGRLAVAHAGIREEMLGQTSGRVRSFCLYGDTSGEVDADGLAVRYHWAAEYAGATTVVYGHTPVAEAEWVNNTLCIDTGCAFGGQLTALRWPERQIVSVPARAEYATRVRPFGHPPPRPR